MAEARVEWCDREGRRGESELLNAQVLIGSSPFAHVQFEDPSLSHFHVRLERHEEGAWHAVDLGSGTGTYVNGDLVHIAPLKLFSAGHWWPSLLRAGDPYEWPRAASTTPWGMPQHEGGVPTNVSLGAGDWSLLAFTDGLIERPRDPGKKTDLDILRRTHRRCRDKSADEICESVFEQRMRHSDTTVPQEDDITLTVLRPAQAQ